MRKSVKGKSEPAVTLAPQKRLDPVGPIVSIENPLFEAGTLSVRVPLREPFEQHRICRIVFHDFVLQPLDAR